MAGPGGDEVYSRRIRAGRRTYYLDVRATRTTPDYYITITESKRADNGQLEKHKIFLYKEDFTKFRAALDDVIAYVEERLRNQTLSGSSAPFS